ncbi:hypothetical protein AXG93_328s1030 [Marchantia polymorpha subsp. ruderalis]|uniref:Reverse transcriptase RNase H-like domain-containing protein n=1 Tax=Marchantia polymorpha subsp. ruderalis TaxID=1480154 RepID=A0A176VQT6_MARPO|nr:hypothetical protein AXG93_328s1030 [Marchantia polymorpha subsp. ruderalis]
MDADKVKVIVALDLLTNLQELRAFLGHVCPDWNKPYHVFVDTSAFAIGAVLSQRDEHRKDFTIYFASRQLSATEKNYTTTEREALGMVFAVKKFRHYLLGYEFVFHLDHYALQHLVKKANLS